MTDLVAFLRARLAEDDEVIARHADGRLGVSRAVRGVTSKRRIVDTCEFWLHDDDRGIDPCAAQVLADLAYEWSTHPDYRPDWSAR